MTTEAEARWIAYWEDKSIHRWDAAAPREDTYVIDTPPPTVSGSLHIGHVFSYTQADMLARFQRMAGMNVYYPMGFDDNGLPTERLVEKVKGVKGSELGREAFVKLCHETVTGFEDEFRALFQRIGLSVDWTQEYQTNSPLAWKISQMSIIDLYNKNHLTRRPQPNLWDPADRTALAQAEVVEKEVQGVMYRLPFFLEEGGDVEIATTRPELLAACVALLCNPADPRAADLVGRTVYSPLFGVPVTIIADEKVDQEKGTGLVMCCTFGDLTDIEWWRTYNLPLRDIVGRDGRIYGLERIGASPEWPTRDPGSAHAAAEKIAGLNVRKAREAMVTALREAGLVRGETQIVQMVPCADRSGAPLEILVSAQWTVNLLDKKQALINCGREMEWYPAFMEQRFEDWVSNLKWDWGISRQRFFGVPLPFWYSKRAGEEGTIIAAHPDDLPVNPLVTPPRGYTMEEVEPDPDVLDTWATSSVSPQINAQGITAEQSLDPARFERLYPADLRPQAHEIIRTWAFYTVAKAMLHTGRAPFASVALSGWCLAPDRQKMSKSKGNGVEPVDLLNQYGTDVVRYWTGNYRLGHDTIYSEDVLKIGKRLVTKLKNAARFVAPHVAAFDGQTATALMDASDGRIVNTIDQWLCSRLHQVVETATNRFRVYDYTDALETAERFFFGEFCDNYLELVKGRIYGEVGDHAGKTSAQLTLGHGLLTILHLLAPFLPFATEEILHETFPKTAARLVSIHARGGWPHADRYPLDEASLEAGQLALDVLGKVRAIKSERGVSIKTPLSLLQVSLPPGHGFPDDLAIDLAHTSAAARLTSAPDTAEVMVEVEWAETVTT